MIIYILFYGPIGCFQIRLRRITTAAIKALTCFCLSPPPGRENLSHPLCGWSLTQTLLYDYGGCSIFKQLERSA
jgi:hypothetical protein